MNKRRMKWLLCRFFKIKNTYSKTSIWTQDTMEVTQFYLHLPSNSSLDKFPNWQRIDRISGWFTSDR